MTASQRTKRRVYARLGRMQHQFSGRSEYINDAGKRRTHKIIVKVGWAHSWRAVGGGA